MKREFDVRSLEIVKTMREFAEVLGVSVMSVYRYKRLPEFPTLPTFKVGIRNWAARVGVPRRRGPWKGSMADRVAELRAKDWSFSAIGKALGISKQAAWKHWKNR